MGARLARTGLSVLLLESGGLDFDAAANALNRLDSSESLYAPRTHSRRRQLGGTAHLWNTRLRQQWGARLIRLDPVDFETRGWLPDSGWPFGIAAIDPFYNEAEALCGISHERDDDEAKGAWFGREDSPIRTYVERFAYGHVFTRDLPKQLKRARNVVVTTNATVTELVSDSSGVRIRGVMCERPGHLRKLVEASVVVLAAGGIENARLMLLSRDVHKKGLGNAHDLVGRYFMDHHRLDWGALVPERAAIIDSAGIFDLVQSKGSYRMGKLTVAPHVLRAEQLLNSSIELAPRLAEDQRRLLSFMRDFVSKPSANAIVTANTLGRSWRSTVGLAETAIQLGWRQGRFPGSVKRGMWSGLKGNHNRFGSFSLLQVIEQGPHDSNRVQLTNLRDELGQCRIQVDCQLHASDLDSVYRTRSLIKEELVRKQIGTVVGREDFCLHQVGGIHHHMGATRMHSSPHRGVTDPQGEVHGVRNLFVVGSSVFPTGGYANPTLTILALAIRTAAYVAQRLVEPAPIAVGS